MDIDRLLNLLTAAAWGLFFFLATVSFLRTTRQYGFRVALRQLTSLRTLVVLMLLVSASLLSSAIVFIEPQEMGVVISILAQQGFREQPLLSGLRWIVPLAERVVVYPNYWQTYTMSSNPLEGEAVGDDSIIARTSDGQEVHLDTSIIFRLDPHQVVRIHQVWQNRYIKDFVRPVVRGVVRTEIAAFNVDEVNSESRQDLERQLKAELTVQFEAKGLILDQFLLRNISFSSDYAHAVEQKQVSEQGRQQRIYEADQIVHIAAGRATEIVRLAQANADARILEARAEATALQLISDVIEKNPDLLTYQYINRISPSLRVMLLPNDNPLILPIDSAMNALSAADTPAAVPTPTPIVPIATPSAIAGTPTPTPSPTSEP